MKKIAVIVAAGSGSRMGSSVPKQFLLLAGKPVLLHTLSVFQEALDDLEVILVLPKDFLYRGEEIIRQSRYPQNVKAIAGGETRFHSVQKGLNLVEGESIVFIHDGVRCLVSKELIRKCYDQTVQFGSAIPVVESRDSVRIITPTGNTPIGRDLVKLVQTPQTFTSSMILGAYRAQYRSEYTDDAMVVEASGEAIHLIEGECNNIKITTPLDLVMAESILSNI